MNHQIQYWSYSICSLSKIEHCGRYTLVSYMYYTYLLAYISNSCTVDQPRALTHIQSDQSVKNPIRILSRSSLTCSSRTPCPTRNISTRLPPAVSYLLRRVPSCFNPGLKRHTYTCRILVSGVGSCCKVHMWEAGCEGGQEWPVGRAFYRLYQDNYKTWLVSLKELVCYKPTCAF